MIVKKILLTALSALCISSAFAQDDDDSPRRSRRANYDYGNNIISFSPLQITDNGLGLGLSYERSLDRRNIVSFYLPAAVTFDNGNYNGSFYFMPGLKFYPTGGKGIVKYAVGPNMVFEFNERTDETSTYFNGQYSRTIRTDNNFLFGMLINNSLNINPTEHLHMNLELGLGFSYINTTKYYDYYSGTSAEGTAPFVQLGFKIGYRF